MLVYSVAGGKQVYSVTNYSTCCFLLHLQLSKKLYKGAEFDSTFRYSIPYQRTNRQTDRQQL